MKEEYKEFVGIYDESVPIDLCNKFVKDYEVAKKNETIIDLSEENETGFKDNKTDPNKRKDESAFITPIHSTIYPPLPVRTYFNFLAKCFECYKKRYTLGFEGLLYNDIFKIHKVKKTEGFHTWHCEKNNPSNLDRILVYMTYLEVPKTGGETEFLHQSLRVEPIVGRTLIWPAAYTHMHRGNPPLDGDKMYITGWFHSPRIRFENGGM